MIIIDTREPDSIKRIEPAVRKLKKLPVDELFTEHALPTGDILITLVNKALPRNLAEYMVWVEQCKLEPLTIEEVLLDPTIAAITTLSKNSVVIERKAPSDFLSSLADGRLFDQAYRLEQSVMFPIIAITGHIKKSPSGLVYVDGRTSATGWNWWSVKMAIYRLQMAGCCVIELNDDDELPEFITYLWKWLLDKGHMVRKSKPAPLIPLSEEAEFLCGIPSIGPTKANEILEYTGSIVSALHFLTNPGSGKLPNRPFGFGLQTINKIRTFFGLADDEILLPVDMPKDNDD